jgi:hypothetical protein
MGFIREEPVANCELQNQIILIWNSKIYQNILIISVYLFRNALF